MKGSLSDWAFTDLALKRRSNTSRELRRKVELVSEGVEI